MIKRICRLLPIVALLSFFMIPLQSSALDGSKSVGLRGGYNTRNESGTAGLYFQYRFTKRFRLATDVDYVFRNKGIDGLLIDINAHVPFDFAGGRFGIYPLAGINYSTWSHHNTGENGSDTSRKKRFGLNFGGGVDMHVTPSLRLFAEGKYTWVKHADCGAVCIGIGYCF